MDITEWPEASAAQRYVHVSNELVTAAVEWVAGLMWPDPSDDEDDEDDEDEAGSLVSG